MKSRIESAANYLQVLEKSLLDGWLTLFNTPPKTIFEQMVLLNPLHLAELDLPEYTNVEMIQNSIQGSRSFPSTIVSNSCQSILLWGYKCELNGDLQQDHLFPYSLGGPTLPANRIFLCRYHNMVKSSDIHSYPWELIDQWAKPWLAGQINKLYKEIFKLYG